MSKPTCKLIGEDGNIFNLMAIAGRTLLHSGMRDKAEEMSARIWECDSYEEALCIIGEYVDIMSTTRLLNNRACGREFACEGFNGMVE